MIFVDLTKLNPNNSSKSREHNEARSKLAQVQHDLKHMEEFVLKYMRHPEATDEDAKVIRTAYTDAYRRGKEAEQAGAEFVGGGRRRRT